MIMIIIDRKGLKEQHSWIAVGGGNTKQRSRGEDVREMKDRMRGRDLREKGGERDSGPRQRNKGKDEGANNER